MLPLRTATDIYIDKAIAADSLLRNDIQQKITSFSNMTVEEVVHSVLNSAIELALKILLALFLYFVGRWIIGRVKKLMKRVFERRKVDESLRTFMNSAVSITLNIFLLLIIIGVLGIDTTSFIALFAAAGVALGMALSGTMQNFAGGVVLLLLKPFKTGDYVNAQGFSGTIKSVSLFHTILNTDDNKTVLIPNGILSNGIVNNYSKEKFRRVEWIIGIDYGQDFDTAKALIKSLLDSDPRVNHKPATPLIEITKLSNYSVDIVVRAWTEAGNYWGLYFDMNAKIYKTLPANGVEFAVPKKDINIRKHIETEGL